MLKIINPYPGFESGFYRPYLEDEHSLFFGRDKDISMLKLKVRQKKLVSLISEPKMGKTSLLRSGLIPNLRQNSFDGHNGSEWKCVYMMPEKNPIMSLAKALVNPVHKVSDKIKPSMEEEVYNQLQKNDYGLVRVAESIIGDRSINILLVIDDYFDVFQPEVDDRERTKFMRLLHKAYLDKSTAFHIVASFNKDDFKNEKMRIEPKLYKAFSMGMHKLQFLDNDGLKKAIDEPARITKSVIANDLSNEMMLMLLKDSDQLRKLQLLMSRTWLEWKRNHKDKTVTKAHYFRATGQKSKAVAKGLMKGGKVSVDHLESLAKQSALADNAEMAKADYANLNDQQKQIFKRIVPHLIDDSGRGLKAVPVERKKVGELLGITMEELGNLVTRIPTILAMDRKRLSINDITIFESWNEIRDWISGNHDLRMKFEQIADAAILHYIDGIELPSVISRQQYKDMFRFVDVGQITESWARAQHDQFELGLDFIQKLQETYGVVDFEDKVSGVKKKMTFGRKPDKTPKDESKEDVSEQETEEDAKIAALAILGIEADVDEQAETDSHQIEVNPAEEVDEDEAIRRLLEGDSGSRKAEKAKELAPNAEIREEGNQEIITESYEDQEVKVPAKKKLTLKPKLKIKAKEKEPEADSEPEKPKMKIKPKIVIKKK